ncbi:putative RNA polymerase, sigma-24 subunit, ECF subfamily [Beutenbergia cavernae DSM 12333]|uniref:Putative RNA polymerase, sigma-24 subunit, ECF subfamily n=1 Tax=Beutenbergia cavernae (strain ATCC BAA-8 / DSM 12333 / CCUG 43141 / JCM 11478 / NBRC 16432 / NCIMB 13614 / HKI 0122) TaxID=471853 RepID=C5C3B1_BEUC1|nr:DUF6596 domain-containing protein [Beutenbergia cavernae]ACQ79810.1 putative RNA polymerase, sigma-24 subunit, ECF subfamily [Beutenbergia cavernae DSM 12333]
MIRAASDDVLVRIVRDEAGLIVGALTRRTGSFDVAEEAVQDAVVTALDLWRRDGVPPNPAGWLTTTAWRNAVDRLRRATRQDAALRRHAERRETVAGEVADVDEVPAIETDERLPMLFACCHPSLAPPARLALSLRAVVGLTTAQIAGAFLVPEATAAQRIVRAKRKIVAAGIPLQVPDGAALPSRLDDVLSVVTLCYNAGYLRADDVGRRLAGDGAWLARVVAQQLPREPEALAVSAMLAMLEARAATRFSADGVLVPLAEQDRSRWDHEAIRAADDLLMRAASYHRPGRFQLQAAITACHTTAPSAAETDWLQVLTLYDMLAARDPSPVVRLNRAVALAEIAGPEAALAEVDSLATQLAGYHLLHATRGDLLARLGRRAEAEEEYAAALERAASEAERALLRTRLGPLV